MNKLLPILVIVSIFLPFGCKFKNYQNCVSKKLIAYQDISGFDYIHFVENFEQYLIENGFLEDSTKQSWEKMIAEELYCQIDRTHLIGEIDDTFSNSPIVGTAFLDCSCIDPSILGKMTADSLNLGKSFAFRSIHNVNPNDFQSKEIKSFFVYQVYLLEKSCE
jgi:hypothetical protein